MALFRDVPTAREIEVLAEAFRRRIPESGPPLDVVEMAALAGIVDITYDDISGSAMLVASTADPNTCGLVLSRREAPVRHRFSIAHEIGHRIVHPDRKAHQFGERIAARKRTERDPIEWSCDRFAAILLMPRAWVIDHERWATSVRQLARRFEVSEAAMKARLRELGLNRLAYP